MVTSAREPAQGARVLVVEDDRDTALLFCSLLEVVGFNARPLSNARASPRRCSKRTSPP